MKHTPLTIYQSHGSYQISAPLCIIDSNDMTIAILDTIDRDDAEHIVKCVNAHDGLIAALKECMDFMPNKGTNIISGQVYQRAKETLKAAWVGVNV